LRVVDSFLAGIVHMVTDKSFLLTAKLANRLSTMAVERKRICARMRSIEKVGWVYASEYWRDGKYFYLLHQVRAGAPRKREYIGTDAERIAAARALIRRGAEYEALKEHLARLDAIVSDVNYRLLEILGLLTGR
jgi:hypothetical protein